MSCYKTDHEVCNSHTECSLGEHNTCSFSTVANCFCTWLQECKCKNSLNITIFGEIKLVTKCSLLYLPKQFQNGHSENKTKVEVSHILSNSYIEMKRKMLVFCASPSHKKVVLNGNRTMSISSYPLGK